MAFFKKDRVCLHKWQDTKPKTILVVDVMTGDLNLSGRVRVVKVCSKCNEIVHFPVLSIKNLREIERGTE
jgi:hypothetical protein